MPRFAFAITIICALVAIIAPAMAAKWPVCSGGNRAACHVTCVVDGDTWWRNGVKYRLACVDALEIDDVGGIEARDELRKILGQADLQVRDLGIKGRYRRSLAIIGVGDTTAGRILCRRDLRSARIIATPAVVPSPIEPSWGKQLRGAVGETWVGRPG